MKGRSEKQVRIPVLRKLLAAVLAAVFLSTGVLPGLPVFERAAITVLAKTSTTDYVATTGLNIRQKASADSKKLGSFAYGDTVKVISISDGWAKISYNKGTAYVSEKYIEKASEWSGGSGKSSNTAKKSASVYSSGSGSGSGSSGGMCWLSATGSKYHSISNCGRMNPNKASYVTIEFARSAGYDACSKCW